MPSIPSQFASTKRVVWLSRSTASGPLTESSRSALPPVPCCGVRVSPVLSRVGQPMVQPEDLRVETYVEDPAWVSRTASPPTRPFGRALAPLGSHWREPVLEESQVWASVSIG